MYTVGSEKLPSADEAEDSALAMTEILAEIQPLAHLSGISFHGEVFEDTDDPEQFGHLSYSGRVTSIIQHPPSFNLLVKEAFRTTAECDCPQPDVDRVFDDHEHLMEEVELSMELDELAGAETECAHQEPMPLEPNTEVTIRFDRLGWYGLVGIVEYIPKEFFE